MFPQRAKLEKNVLTHAVYCGIEGINAVPAELTINLDIKADDVVVYTQQGVELTTLSVDSTSAELASLTSVEFPLKAKYTFDHTCPIKFDDYEFHLDYDIELTGVKRSKTSNWVFKALYVMGDKDNGTADFLKNTLSPITNEYLKQPIITTFNNYTWVFLQTTVHQYTIETTEDKMITASVIDNKSFTFTFDNQIAAFEVYITENNTTTRLTPYFYGSAIAQGAVNYCWYLYMNDSTVRIGFDQNSYIPGLSAEVKVVAYTTLGAAGNFNYKNNLSDSGTFAEFVDSNSKKITCYANCASNSTLGTDRKTVDELKKLIPKMALSRGYITTETDLNGYFNLISTANNKLKLQKKVDNQLNRIWYCYLLAKDSAGNIIPSNTLPIKVTLTDIYVKAYDSNTRYVIPAGTTFVYSKSVGYCTYIAESSIPKTYSYSTTDTTSAAGTYYFDQGLYYYRIYHDIVININPLYCAFYNTLVNQDGYFQYNYINENLIFGFIANTNHIVRSMFDHADDNASTYVDNSYTNKEYRFTFSLVQSVAYDYGLITQTKITNVDGSIEYVLKPWDVHMKVFLIIYQNETPYRYAEATCTSFDSTSYTSTWEVDMTTDDDFDTNNRIKLEGLYETGYDTTADGYFDANCTATIAILADNELVNSGNDPYQTKVSGIIGSKNLTIYNYVNNGTNANPDWEISTTTPTHSLSLMNIYSGANGLTLFENYTEITDTRVRANTSSDNVILNYDISGVPMIGEHFFTVNSKHLEDNVQDFMSILSQKKAYIDYCLTVLENNMNIDFKMYNTYGYSYEYEIGDTAETSLGNIDTVWQFKIQLVNNNDVNTKDSIILYIKKYIEDLNESGSDLHVTNLLHDIKDQYSSLINYVEFVNFNGNALGVNHILMRDDITATTVPEFINVRNILSDDGTTLTPAITVTTVI